MSKRRLRFNSCGQLVASSNPVRVSLIKRFNIVSRYNDNIFSITHSTLTFKTHE